MTEADGGGLLPLALIAAVARNGVIGAGNALPWRLPDDLRHFRTLTMGKPMLMGRKTYESIGRPLPGRPTVVLSRDPAFQPAGVSVRARLEEALGEATTLGRALAAPEIMVAGGGELYRALIGQAARLYVTEVDASPAGDTIFPPIDPALWRLVGRHAQPPAASHDTALVFVVYERF